MKSDSNFEKAIDLNSLFQIFYKMKKFIIVFSLLSGLASLVISLSLTNIYTSSALLKPTNSSQSLSDKAGAYSTIAGIAGVPLPSDGSSKSQEAIARMQSFDFFTNEVLPNIKLQNLLAVKSWDNQFNEIIYDKDIFNAKKNTWLNDKSYKPSDQEAYKKFREILYISEDKQTLFVTIKVDHPSPYIAQKWASLMVDNINSYMRVLDKTFAQKSINFLQDTYQTTNLEPLLNSISLLLEEQIQKLMLIESSENYVFDYIEKPYAPEKKSKPIKSLIVILGTLFGIFVSLILSLFIYSKESTNKLS